MNVVVFLVVMLFVSLSMLHFYWAFGGKLGVDKAIPEINGKPAMEPGALITAAVAVALLGFAVIAYLLGFADLTSAPYGNYVVYSGWLLAGVFALRAIGDFNVVGFFKKVKSSDFAKCDTKYYSPLCLTLSVLFMALTYEQA